MSYKPSKIPSIKGRIDRIKATTTTAVAKHTAQFAETAVSSFKKRIREQDFTAFQEHPLSEAYLAYKARSGLDLRTMIRTGNYVRKLRTFKTRTPFGVSFMVGHAPTDMASDDKGVPIDMTLNTLAKIHEYGSAARNIPARPHWKPHLRRLQRKLPLTAMAIRREIERSSHV